MSDEDKPSQSQATPPAKEHQHRFWHHFKKAGKKLGFWGGVFLVLHILFHVVEILILPALLVWLGIKS